MSWQSCFAGNKSCFLPLLFNFFTQVRIYEVGGIKREVKPTQGLPKLYRRLQTQRRWGTAPPSCGVGTSFLCAPSAPNTSWSLTHCTFILILPSNPAFTFHQSFPPQHYSSNCALLHPTMELHVLIPNDTQTTFILIQASKIALSCQSRD